MTRDTSVGVGRDSVRLGLGLAESETDSRVSCEDGPGDGAARRGRRRAGPARVRHSVPVLGLRGPASD